MATQLLVITALWLLYAVHTIHAVFMEAISRVFY